MAWHVTHADFVRIVSTCYNLVWRDNGPNHPTTKLGRTGQEDPPRGEAAQAMGATNPSLHEGLAQGWWFAFPGSPHPYIPGQHHTLRAGSPTWMAAVLSKWLQVTSGAISGSKVT